MCLQCQASTWWRLPSFQAGVGISISYFHLYRQDFWGVWGVRDQQNEPIKESVLENLKDITKPTQLSCFTSNPSACGSAVGLDLIILIFNCPLPTWHQTILVHRGDHCVIKQKKSLKFNKYGFNFLAIKWQASHLWGVCSGKITSRTGDMTEQREGR